MEDLLVSTSLLHFVAIIGASYAVSITLVSVLGLIIGKLDKK